MDTLLTAIIFGACATVMLACISLLLLFLCVARFLFGKPEKLRNESGGFKLRVYEWLDEIF
jgi:hypothetical protein